jgi:deoxyribodipyrimidine photolyase
LSAILDIFSDFLRQRISIFRDGKIEGKYVLYWMKHAVRAHENPALDVALQISKNLSLPLLVYQEISEEEPYASERRFAFEIDGARDVQQELRQRSIDYLFWIQRRNSSRLLDKLAAEAAIVVAEDMPVPSERHAKQRLHDNSDVPIWLVDTACIVPMQVAGKPYDRAFVYRQRTAEERASRLEAAYNEIDYRPSPMPNLELPEATIALAHLDLTLLLSSGLSSLLASLDIDHEVKPVGDTTGGSTAGYQRWRSFVEKQLPRYDRDRNDPLLAPSSRMSAYLRLGHVSPFLIAREAAALKSAAADKFLDELLVWRELAYTFCRFTPQLESSEAIPAWAIQSLRDHEPDRRPQIYSYDELFFAKTGDRFWNAAQLSLLNRGEIAQ